MAKNNNANPPVHPSHLCNFVLLRKIAVFRFVIVGIPILKSKKIEMN
jgi:hypothetical protein